MVKTNMNYSENPTMRPGWVMGFGRMMSGLLRKGKQKTNRPVDLVTIQAVGPGKERFKVTVMSGAEVLIEEILKI